MTVVDELRGSVIEGQVKAAVAKVTEALEAGIPAGTFLDEGLIAGMKQVGQLYEEGEVFVPEMLVAARAMRAALAVLKPHLVEEGGPFSGRVSQSAGRVATCFDNSGAEAFCSTLKRELVHRYRIETPAEAKTAIG